MGLGFTQQLTQYLGIPCPPLPPVNYAVNTAGNITGWAVAPVDMGFYRRAMGFVNVGTVVGVSATNCVNVAFLAGNTSNTLQAVTGAAWTWTTVTNGPTQSVSGNNNFVTLEIRSDQMPSGTRYLALLVSNVQAAIFDACLIGAEAAYEPGGVGNIAVTLNSGVGQLNTSQGVRQTVASI